MTKGKVLELKNVRKSFDGKNVIDNISFHVNKNDIFGFLGPNGAGKTTTIRLILDLLKLDQGSILINGEKISNKTSKLIGVCLDNEGFYENMTCRENLEFFDKIYNNKNGREKRINDIALKMGLENSLDKRVHEFSKGMRKRLGIARAIIHNPEIIILDEPLAGLDPEGQELLKSIIKDLSKRSTIFFSSHNLGDVQDICNKIAILNKSITRFGDISDMLEELKSKLILTLNKNCTYEELNFILTIEGVTKLDVSNNKVIIEYKDNLDIGDIVVRLKTYNYRILNFEKDLKSIKDVYFESLKEIKNV